MKRALIVILLLLLCPAAMAAAGVTLDESALTWYAEAATAVMEAEAVPITVEVGPFENARMLWVYYDASEGGKATIEEALTAEDFPADLYFVYDPTDDAVGFLFSRGQISEIPEAAEIYADGKRLVGDMHIKPEDVDGETEMIGLWFARADVEAMLGASYSFMRLETDKGSSFIETNADDMPLSCFMLGLVCNGVDYACKGGDAYLKSDLLLTSAPDWITAAPASAPANGKDRVVPFQTDYAAIDKAAKSAFLLEVYDADDQMIATGSGFVVFDKGTLITNEHVIRGAAYIIAHSDQYKASYKLTEVKAADAELDIAVLKFDAAANVLPLTVDAGAELLRGQPVTAIGSPQGVLNTVSSGNISNIVYYSEQIPDYIQFTAPISPGSSGGALFNDQGNVIGLCVGSLSEGQAMYYAIPIKYVEAVYEAAGNTKEMLLTAYNNQDIAAPELMITSEGVWLGWEAMPGAQSYVIYRRLAGSNGSFTRLGEVLEENYLDNTVQDGKVYEYRVGVVMADATRLSAIATMAPKDASVSVPEESVETAAIRIDTTVMASNGEYTITWTDDGSAPYRIMYTPVSYMGETYGDEGVSESSYTTVWMIPGQEYRVTVMNARGDSATANVKVPDAAVFEDGSLTAKKVGIQIAPRCDEDGQNGPGNPIYTKTLFSVVMEEKIRDFGWSYGLYYRFDLPSFKGSRTYLQTVVFQAPNGFEYIWDVGKYEFSYLSNGGWWKWNIMGEEFFQALMEKFDQVPVGQYYVDLYWNGMLVNSQGFQVK